MSEPTRGVFVRVPKTASTSIESILGDYPHVLLNSRLEILPRENFVERWTQTGLARLWMESLGGEAWTEHFTFAFVRNPYGRAISSWQHVRRLKQKGVAISRPPETEGGGSGELTLDTFLQLLEEDTLVGQAKWHSTRQSVHLTDDSGEMVVDFLGRFENLQGDFDHICRTMEIPPTRLPHLKRSAIRQDFRTHLTPATRAVVERAYAADFELLDYRFER